MDPDCVSCWSRSVLILLAVGKESEGFLATEGLPTPLILVRSNNQCWRFSIYKSAQSIQEVGPLAVGKESEGLATLQLPRTPDSYEALNLFGSRSALFHSLLLWEL